MKYNNITAATFIERENRFVAIVELANKIRKDMTGDVSARSDSNSNFNLDPALRCNEVRVHVKNTGRCRELLVPGATVYLEDHIEDMKRSVNSARKYRYSLIAVEKNISRSDASGHARLEPHGDSILINMDSQAPNKVVHEALSSGKLRLPGQGNSDLIIRPEVTFGSSRFDFFVEYPDNKAAKNHEQGAVPPEGDPRTAFIEVKGVTLEDEGIARFPDAPTERGVKHIRELEKAMEEGHEAYIIFVIQMKGVRYFEPNDETHPEFGEALRHAKKTGVHILAYDCMVSKDELVLDRPVPVHL